MDSKDLEDLRDQIQHLRKKLIEISANRELTDPEVIGASQLLDGLLLEYEKMLIKKK